MFLFGMVVMATNPLQYWESKRTSCQGHRHHNRALGFQVVWVCSVCTLGTEGNMIVCVLCELCAALMGKKKEMTSIVMSFCIMSGGNHVSEY